MNHPQSNPTISKPTLRDLTGNVPIVKAAESCMSIANAMQQHDSRGARLMGAAAMFLLMSECAGIQIPELIGMAKNCINHAEGRRPEFAAVTDYINNEVL